MTTDKTLSQVTLAALCIALGATALGCLEPTEAILDISTNGACSAVNATGISAGKDGSVEHAPYDTTTTQCQGEGDIGSIVLLPDGDKKGPLAFRVVTSLGSTPVESCKAPDYGPGCIVARRSMRFVPNHPFHVPLTMTLACAGVICPDAQTCVEGTCVSSDIDPDDCDGLAGCDPGAGEKPPFAKQFGGPGSQMARHLARGADGVIAITGNFTDEINLGGGALSSRGQNDIFLATYTQTGLFRWATAVGGTGDDEGASVAIAADGAIYTLGLFEDTVDFGGGKIASHGKWDVVLRKVTAFGQFVWAVGFGGPGLDTAGKVAVDATGNVYVTGAFFETADIAGVKLEAAGDYDALIASFTPDGKLRWAKSLGGAGPDSGNGIAVDGGGNVYVGGSFSKQVELDTEPIVAVAGGDAFVARFDADGSLRWAKPFGAKGQDLVIDLAARDEQIVATGVLTGEATIGDEVIPAAHQDGFVAAFDPSGRLVWSRAFGDESGNQGTTVDIAADGSTFLGGSLMAGSAFTGPVIKKSGFRNPFVAVLDRTGDPLWVRQFKATPSFARADASSIAASPDGYAYLAGWFTDKLELGDETFTSDDAEDLMLLRIAPPE
jgi:hypothetical protein